MKLIIQIPCFNEGSNLPLVFKDMPRHIDGVDVLEYQIIDDGSTDNTVEVAQALGVHHVVCIPGKNRAWAGRAFNLGASHALALGADIVVNLDGNGAYPSALIRDLVRPILDGQADVVFGNRDPSCYQSAPRLISAFQRLGSFIIERLTGEATKDPDCSFRAFNAQALLQINLTSRENSTVDSLVQAHEKGLRVVWVKVHPNPLVPPSFLRIFSSKITKSALAALRFATIYHPVKVLLALAVLFIVPGLILLVQASYSYLSTNGSELHYPTALTGAFLLFLGIQSLLFAFMGDLQQVNRTLTDEVLTRLKRVELINGLNASNAASQLKDTHDSFKVVNE